MTQRWRTDSPRFWRRSCDRREPRVLSPGVQGDLTALARVRPEHALLRRTQFGSMPRIWRTVRQRLWLPCVLKLRRAGISMETGMVTIARSSVARALANDLLC